MSTWRNMLYSGFAQIGALIAGIIMSVVLARSLGPEQRGIYAIIVASVALLSALVNFGLEPAFVYLAGKRKHTVQDLAGHAIWFTLSIVAVVAALVLVVPDAVFDTIFRGLPHSTIWLVLLL